MRLKNRLIIPGIWLGVILMALAACSGDSNRLQTQEAEATITVQEIVNRVEVNGLHPETKEPAFVDLQLGQFLQTGNVVKTHENSSARVDISLQNFTRVSRTGPKTIWRLGRFALNGEAVIELEEGKILVFDEGDGQEHWPLHIETPAGTASARGTWMAVEFDPESGTAQVECLRGICELENDLGYQVFTNEQVVVATAVTVPADPAPMTELQIKAFEELPEVLTEEIPIPVKFTPVEVQVKLEEAKTAAVERLVLNEDHEFIPHPVSDAGDEPGIDIPLSVSKPADDGLEDSTEFGEPEVSEDSRPQTQDYTGPEETAFLITDGLEALGISGLGERGKTEEETTEKQEKELDKALEQLAKAHAKATEQLVKSQSRASEELAQAQTKIAQRLIDARAKIAEALVDAADKGAGEFFLVEARLAEDLAKAEERATEDLAKAEAKASETLAKAQAKATKEFAKAEAKSAEELAKVQTEIGQELIFARPNGPDGAARAGEELAKVKAKATEELAKAEAKAGEELAKAQAKAGEELAKAQAKATEELAKAQGKAGEVLAKAYAKAMGKLNIVFDTATEDHVKATEKLAKAVVKAAEVITKAESRVAANTVADDSGTNTVADDSGTSSGGGDGSTTGLTTDDGGSTTVTTTDGAGSTTDTTTDEGSTDNSGSSSDDGGSSSSNEDSSNTPANTVPVAVNDTASAASDTTVSIDVLQNDSDADGDTLTVTNLTQPSNGEAKLKSDNTVEYRSNKDFTGTDTFTYRANDGTADSNVATVTITVSDGNTAPVAVNDTATTAPDVAVTISVLGNDSDTKGDTLSVTNLTQPSNGTAAVNGDNTVLYTPGSGFTGVVTFTYTANDGRGDSNVATVTVTVSAGPVAVDDTGAGGENAAQININVLANDTDPDGDSLTITNLTQPSNGSVVIKSTNNTVDYTPNSGFTGVDTFTYTANDGTSDSDVATVTVTVNSKPVPVDDAASTLMDVTVTIDVLANDTDADGDALTIDRITHEPTNGTVTINSDNTIDYTPNSGFTGTDTFKYKAFDGKDNSNDRGTVTVTVTVSNTAPVAFADTGSTLKDVAVTIDVLANDTDADGSDTHTVTNLSTPSNGTASVNGDNTVLYTPGSGFTGIATFTYTANDGTEDSNSATVTVTVSAANTAPVAVADAASTETDVAVTINVLSNDTDVDSDTLSVTNLTQPSNGTAAMSGDNVLYTPSSGWTGTDTFTYTANDGTEDSSSATVTVTVAAAGVPVAVNDTGAGAENANNININVLSNDTDSDGGSLTITNLTQPSNGSVAIKPQNNTVNYTPNSGFTGVDTFTYTANDGTSDSSVVTVTVTVAAANNAPVAVNDTASTVEDVAVNISVLANDTDADGDSLTVANLTQPTNGSVTVSSNNKVDYTPNSGFIGVDTFTYTANDGTDDSNVATVTVTVTAAGAPVAVNDTASGVENANKITIDVLQNDSDPEGDPLTVTNLTQPSNGTATVKPNKTVEYVPNSGFFGQDTFTYTANDGTDDSSVATVTVTVS